MPRRLLAETIGTALLVFFGCGTATLMFGLGFRVAGTYGVGVFVTAFAFGLVLVGIAYAFGAVSGAHVNPAVTLGALAAGRMQLVEAAYQEPGPYQQGRTLLGGAQPLLYLGR